MTCKGLICSFIFQISLPADPAWYEVFGVSFTEIKDICHTILKLYSRKRPDQAKLEAIIDDLRKEYQNSKKQKMTFDNGDTEERAKNGVSKDGEVVIDKNSKENHSERMRDKSSEKLTISTTSPKVVKEGSERLKRRSPSRESPVRKHKSSTKSEIRSTVKTAGSSRNNVESPYYDSAARKRSPHRYVHRARSRSRERKDYEKERDRRYSSHHDYHNDRHHRRHHNSNKSRNNC